jgi:hypothetical protein
MNLTLRVARLEAVSRMRAGQPCRWHGGVAIHPPTLARGADGCVIPPPCGSPATCPGASAAQIFLPERGLV